MKKLIITLNDDELGEHILVQGFNEGKIIFSSSMDINHYPINWIALTKLPEIKDIILNSTNIDCKKHGIFLEFGICRDCENERLLPELD